MMKKMIFREVKKGDVIRIEHNLTGEIREFRFSESLAAYKKKPAGVIQRWFPGSYVIKYTEEETPNNELLRTFVLDV